MLRLDYKHASVSLSASRYSSQFSVGDSEPSVERVKSEVERSTVEKRFAYNLLDKLIQYLEQASVKMKPIKPSQELTRRNTFKKEGQDVKFFEKVSLFQNIFLA